jgi:hypothetical protein
MNQIIVPLYNAEQIDFRFNTKPAVRFEKWNRQIERVAMKKGEPEDIPDAVAIFEEQIDPNQSIDTLLKLGLNILPLIFEKTYFVYQVANEKEVFQRCSTSFSIYKKGRTWIDKEHLQSFLDIATCSLAKYDLHLSLNLMYESEFRASAVEVKFFLLSIILETLSNKFINPKRDSKISQETINQMLGVAKAAMDTDAKLKDTERSRWYDLIKGNLQDKLTIKSNREMIFEFLTDKCRLNVEEQTVKDIVRLRGKFVHSGMFDYGNKEDLQTYKNLDYLARICIIVCLTDFNTNFSNYLTPHEFLGPKFFKW